MKKIFLVLTILTLLQGRQSAFKWLREIFCMGDPSDGADNQQRSQYEKFKTQIKSSTKTKVSEDKDNFYILANGTGKQIQLLDHLWKENKEKFHFVSNLDDDSELEFN